MFVGDRRDVARCSRGAPRRCAKSEMSCVRLADAVLTPQRRAKAEAFVLPPLHLSRGDAPDAKIACRAARSRRIRGRRPGAVLSRRPDCVRRAEGTDDGMLVYSSTQHPSEMQHLVAHMLGWPSHNVMCECRRMGGGFGGKESQSARVRVCARRSRRGSCIVPGQAARRPRRRLHDHRQAPRLPSTRTKSAIDDDGRDRRRAVDMPRARLIPPTCRAPVATRAVCHFDNAYYLPDVDIVALLRQDQHAVEHRVPRLRRTARRVRASKYMHRQRRALGRHAIRSTCACTIYYGKANDNRRRTVRRSRTTSSPELLDGACRDERLPASSRGDRARSTRRTSPEEAASRSRRSSSASAFNVHAFSTRRARSSTSTPTARFS